MNTYKVVVAATNASGESDFFFCKVNCTEVDHGVGRHYEIAKDAAKDNGYEGSMVAFDELDSPAKELFKMFEWDSASLYF
jgi:hypothetical protein